MLISGAMPGDVGPAGALRNQPVVPGRQHDEAWFAGGGALGRSPYSRRRCRVDRWYAGGTRPATLGHRGSGAPGRDRNGRASWAAARPVLISTASSPAIRPRSASDEVGVVAAQQADARGRRVRRGHGVCGFRVRGRGTAGFSKCSQQDRRAPGGEPAQLTVGERGFRVDDRDWPGLRPAAEMTSAASPKPHRCNASNCRATRSGRPGRSRPRRAIEAAVRSTSTGSTGSVPRRSPAR